MQSQIISKIVEFRNNTDTLWCIILLLALLLLGMICCLQSRIDEIKGMRKQVIDSKYNLLEELNRKIEVKNGTN